MPRDLKLDGRPDDPSGLELRVADLDPDLLAGPDLLGERLTTGPTAWTVDLDDPCAWAAIPAAEEPSGG